MTEVEKKRKLPFDIMGELRGERYEQVVDHSNMAQRELLNCLEKGDKRSLEHIILMGRYSLDFCVETIQENKLWYALVRCGAWLGTLEAVQKMQFEKGLDHIVEKHVDKEIASIKHLPEIVGLLEVKGVMTHGEIKDALGLRNMSTLSEIMRKIQKLDLIDVRKAGKYSLYSLTDAGVRYGKLLRRDRAETDLLEKVIYEYGLTLKSQELHSYLSKLAGAPYGTYVSTGDRIRIKLDNENLKHVDIAQVMQFEDPPVVAMKSTKMKMKDDYWTDAEAI